MMRRIGMFGRLCSVMTMLWVTGCASLDEYRAAQRANNNLAARNSQLEQDLQDCRASVDLLNARLDSAEDELKAKRELLASLQAENSLLNEKIARAQRELEELGRTVPGPITIEGAKLPEPLDTALKQFAQAHPNEVEYDAARGFVKWKADLLFDLGSDVVRDSAKEALRGFADILNSNAAQGFEVAIVGHTCTTPIRRSETMARHPTNWHLSAHRAISVGDILMQYGYAPQRVGVMGFGEFRPIADNATTEGKAKNRRVEIYLVQSGRLFAMRNVLDTVLDNGARFAQMGQ